MISSRLAGASVSRLDTMISSGLASESASKPDAMVNSMIRYIPCKESNLRRENVREK